MVEWQSNERTMYLKIWIVFLPLSAWSPPPLPPISIFNILLFGFFSLVSLTSSHLLLPCACASSCLRCAFLGLFFCQILFYCVYTIACIYFCYCLLIVIMMMPKDFATAFQLTMIPFQCFKHTHTFWIWQHKPKIATITILSPKQYNPMKRCI